MNEVRNCLFCTIDDSNKCVRINQVADCGNEHRETITAMTVEFTSDNFDRASEQLNFDEPLPVNIGKDRLQQEVSKLVIAHYGDEYQWMKDDCFDVMPDTEIWHIGRRLSCLILVFFASLTSFALTETINGVTWNYYIENDYAVLGREHGGCAHTGILPERLELPTILGGVPVRAIAAGAIQVGLEVDTIIIPASYTNMASVSICNGDGSDHHLSGEERHFRYTIGSSREIFFKGNKPSINLPSTIETGGTKFSYAYSGSKACKTRIVEGTEGWPTVGIYGYNLLPWNGIAAGCCEYGAAKVEIAPLRKVFTGVTSVSLSCTNKTAKIYYTLDGSDPMTNQTTNCFLYEDPFTISHRTQVKALAYVTEYPYQVVYSNEYALGQTAVPVMTAAEGTVFNWSGNSVTLSCETEDSEIRYTLDGREPTEKSMLYTGPFVIDETTTVKAKAFKADWFDSETVTATFTRQWFTVETPVITPGDTTFANASQEVGLSCATEGAMILYTTDGSDPVVNGREYKRPFKVYSTCTVRAVAVKSDWKNSDEATVTMTRGEPLSEAVNLYGYKLGTNADKPWVVDTAVSHDSVSSIRSNGDGSYVQTSVNGKGTLSFWWRAMCEEPGYEWYDHGAFVTGGDTVSRIAGEDTGWMFFSMTFSTLGKHVLRWEYHKDEEGDYYPDCIWLDQVQWIPADGSGYTLTTPEPVPYSWLTGYNLGLDSDFETAARQATGKVDAKGRSMAVWQDYVAGTDPTNPNDFLRAVISLSNDVPYVSWTPNLNTNGEVRMYTVMGKTNLTDAAWTCPTNAAHRFFKVKVEMP